MRAQKNVDDDAYRAAQDLFAHEATTYARDYDKAVLTIAAGTLAVMGNVLLGASGGPAHLWLRLLLAAAAVSLLLALVFVLMAWVAGLRVCIRSSWALGKRARGDPEAYRVFDKMMDTDDPDEAVRMALVSSRETFRPSRWAGIALVVGLALLMLYGLLA